MKYRRTPITSVVGSSNRNKAIKRNRKIELSGVGKSTFSSKIAVCPERKF